MQAEDALGNAGGAAGVADAQVVLRADPHRRGLGRPVGGGRDRVLADPGGARAQGEHRRHVDQGGQLHCLRVPFGVHEEDGGVDAGDDPGEDGGAHPVVEVDHPGTRDAHGVAGGERLGGVAGEEGNRVAAADASGEELVGEAVGGGGERSGGEGGAVGGGDGRPVGVPGEGPQDEGGCADELRFVHGHFFLVGSNHGPQASRAPGGAPNRREVGSRGRGTP